MHRRHCLAGLTLLAAGGLPRSGGAQQQFPNGKPIRIVVGFAPGGPADTLARVLTQPLAAALGAPVVVENRPGAGGTLAAAAVARAPADGHTLLLVTSGHAGTGALYPNLPYAPETDFAAVAALAQTPNVVLVRAESPYRTITDLISAARARPGALSFGAGGGGATLTALSAELLKRATGFEAEAINYPGSAPAATALVGGQLDFLVDTLSSAAPLIEGGRMRALAVTSAARSARMPEVPTLAETVAPGFDVVGWFGVLAPAASPAPVLERLNREMNAALQEPTARARIAELGLEPIGGGTAAFGALLTRETARWGGLIRELGLQP